MKNIVIAILLVLLVFYITNPTVSEFETFLSDEIEKEIKHEESNESKLKMYLDELVNLLVKEEVYHSIQRDNYYFFSLYSIDSMILEGEFIGIFRLFIPMELRYKSFDELIFKDKQNKNEETTIIYKEYELGEMYTNIATENKIAKFNVIIEYTKPEVLSRITNNKTKIMNNIYEIFRLQQFNDIKKPQGQKKLRDEIQRMIIRTINTDSETISNIYFSEFIIQG